jgi:hypothetical protein
VVVPQATPEQSLRLLDGEPVAQTLRLSRRTRLLPVAVDRDGDAAATLFLRRGVSGEPWLDAQALERAGSSWRPLGGGGGNADQQIFEARRPAAEVGAVAEQLGGGGSLRNAGRRMPWGAKWVHWAELRMAAEVRTLLLPARSIPVAEHGLALVVWTSKRPPVVVAADSRGCEVGRVTLHQE